MASSREKKRTNDPEGMRNKVLDVAEVAFQARGYHASSLGDLMAAAGVSGGALHHHFPTKKALALAVIEERVAAAGEETWIVPGKAAASGREGGRLVFEAGAGGIGKEGFVGGRPPHKPADRTAPCEP